MKRYVCPICGYVHEGDAAPEKCPQCGVPASKFTEQSGEMSWAAEHVLGVGKVFGADVPEERADALIEKLEEKYPESEFMSRNGGQPLYSYYFSVV